MNVLCLNVGSSSVKWSALELPAETLSGSGSLAIAGAVDLSPLQSKPPPALVAHRLVHGGPRFVATTRLDAQVEAELAALTGIDPLHLPRALEGIAAARKAYPGVPQYACFDTAFHRTLPEAAFTYAIPRDWSARYGLRRYGFHGLSVEYALERSTILLKRAPRRLLVCHLGSGSSLTAVRDGRSVDTTMGFTPLEGVPMATRSGSVDPGLLLYLMREKEFSAAALEDGLQRDSGLKGLFGGTGDVREVIAARQEGDPSAGRAYAVLLTGLRRAFGAMLSALEGLDAVVFTGGIGEHQPGLRADVLAAFAWLGLAVDPERNAAPVGDALLSSDAQAIAVLRIEAREDLVMARSASAAAG